MSLSMDMDEDDDFYAPEESAAITVPEPAHASPADLVPARPEGGDAQDELEEGEEEDEPGEMDEGEESVRWFALGTLLVWRASCSWGSRISRLSQSARKVPRPH